MSTSYEEMRKNKYEDVYVYLVEDGDRERKECRDYCTKHRYIPHFVFGDYINELTFLSVPEYHRVVFYSHNIPDLNYTYFSIRIRRVEVEFVDGYKINPDVEEICVRHVESFKEKVRIRRVQKASKGYYIMSSAPYGYKKKGDDLFQDEYESFIVRFIFYRRSQGFGSRRIATELAKRGFTNRNKGLFNFKSVESILSKKDFYAGYLTQEGLPRMKGRHTPILNADGSVNMNYIKNKLQVDKEYEIIKKQRERKAPKSVSPYIEVKKYADIRRL